MATNRPIKLKLQIYCGEEIAMGPGKADLLDAIDQAGSISGGAGAILLALPVRTLVARVEDAIHCYFIER